MLGLNWQDILLHMGNFTLLALVLHFVLYKPIKNFMEERDSYYKNLEDKTNQNLIESEEKSKLYDEELKNINEKADKIIQETITEARQQAETYLQDARKKANIILVEAEEKALKEREKILKATENDIKLVIAEGASKIVHLNKEQLAGNEVYDEFLSHIGEVSNER